MRQETQKIARAFYIGRAASAARTTTDGNTVWLHGNKIAWRTDYYVDYNDNYRHRDIGFTLAGWPTVTTRERINGILEKFGYGYWGVAQRKGDQYLMYLAEKVMPLGDSDSFYLSDLKGLQSHPDRVEAHERQCAYDEFIRETA